jgi:hypothetical protein
MRKLPFIFGYLILAALWCVFSYQYLAPVKDRQLMLLLPAESLFYGLVWGLFVSLLHPIFGWKGYGMLLIPLAIMIVFFLGMDKSNFVFMLGLIVISEMVSLAKIYSYRHGNKT